jgi:hypothetical protein
MTMHVAWKRNICAKSRPSFDARRNNGVEGGIVGHCLSAAQRAIARATRYTQRVRCLCVFCLHELRNRTKVNLIEPLRINNNAYTTAALLY